VRDDDSGGRYGGVWVTAAIVFPPGVEPGSRPSEGQRIIRNWKRVAGIVAGATMPAGKTTAASRKVTAVVDVTGVEPAVPAALSECFHAHVMMLCLKIR
jgi:hypothetical protein